MKGIFIALFLFAFNVGFAQVEIYKAFSTKPKDEKLFLKNMKEQNQKQLEKVNSKYHKYFKEYFGQIYENRVKDLAGNKLIFDDGIHQYFKRIFEEIIQSNEEIVGNRSFDFFLERNASPNAYAQGDGSITFQTGLLMYCENESQLAFIICHELSHELLKHAQTKLKKNVEFRNSKERKEREKEISQIEYGGRQVAIDYLKEVLYNKSKHSREYEFEADSLGIRMFMNTKYDAREALRVMEILDTMNTVLTKANFSIKEVFNFPKFPFKEKWLESENTLFKGGKLVDDDSLQKDSMKTHPDCKLRKGKMHTCCVAKLPTTQVRPVFIQSDALFRDFTKKAAYETLYALFEEDDIANCLFIALNHNVKYPNDVTIQYIISSCLNSLYDAQKDHVFSKKVPLPKRGMELDVLQFIEFLYNLKLSEIGGLAYHYAMSLPGSYRANEHILHCMIVASKNHQEKQAVEAFKKLYLEKFPEGTYADEVKSF